MICLVCSPVAAEEHNKTKTPDWQGKVMVDKLIKTGASQLAIHHIDQHQPPLQWLEDWWPWEKQRFAIYRSNRKWSELLNRIDSWIKEVPGPVKYWAWEQAADASMRMGDTKLARSFLRQLIWDPPPEVRNLRKKRTKWQRWVIRNYLVEDNARDANTALQRYQYEYRPTDKSWRHLRARILLRIKKPKKAFDVVRGIQTHEGKLLGLLAALRSGLVSPKDVARQAKKLLARTKSRQPIYLLNNAVIAQAARTGKDDTLYIQSLEKMLSLEDTAAQDPWLKVDVDLLWKSYQRFAEDLGNQGRLLVGEDKKWLARAKRYEKKRDSRARTIYAFLAFNGEQEQTRLLGHKKLIKALSDQGMIKLVARLYAESELFKDINKIPPEVRYQLLDQAILDGNIHFAAELIKDLDAPKSGSGENLHWPIRQARILIYAGKFVPAVNKLSRFFLDHPKLDDKTSALVMQVLFDLQAIRQNEPALQLFKQLYKSTGNAKYKREILYWMADSQLGLKRYAEAAELYLASAAYGRRDGNDFWGQTARFHGAEAMARAGMAEDARNIYSRLLAITADARQRTLIKRNIQQLWLLKNKSMRQ